MSLQAKDLKQSMVTGGYHFTSSTKPTRYKPKVHRKSNFVSAKNYAYDLLLMLGYMQNRMIVADKIAFSNISTSSSDKKMDVKLSNTSYSYLSDIEEHYNNIENAGKAMFRAFLDAEYIQQTHNEIEDMIDIHYPKGETNYSYLGDFLYKIVNNTNSEIYGSKRIALLFLGHPLFHEYESKIHVDYGAVTYREVKSKLRSEERGTILDEYRDELDILYKNGDSSVKKLNYYQLLFITWKIADYCQTNALDIAICYLRREDDKDLNVLPILYGRICGPTLYNYFKNSEEKLEIAASLYREAYRTNSEIAHLVLETQN